MLQILNSSWALLLGIMLLMVGNGVQGTLLGIRGEIEGFSTVEMSVVMSAYFVGFLGGSRMTPEMIRRVGHVRVFAALGSLISAVLILYPTLTDPWIWSIGRVIIGFCFSGVYVTAESWLNNASTNETRGQTLSAYIIVQMVGIVAAQALVVTADPSGFVLFVIPSVLVSIAFAPILLSVTPTPAFESTKPMSLRALYSISPLGCVGQFLLGGVFSAMFGMAGVFGTRADLSVAQISIFVASFYVGALFLQYPIGWFSDRMDRRRLIVIVSVIGAVAAFVALTGVSSFVVLVGTALVIGGVSNPLYSLLIAHTNDMLSPDDMAAASGGMIFINGMGAISGPLIVGWMMGWWGPGGFYVYLLCLLAGMAAYTMLRMTQRQAQEGDETTAFAPVNYGASPVMLEAVQEYALENAGEESEATS